MGRRVLAFVALASLSLASCPKPDARTDAGGDASKPTLSTVEKVGDAAHGKELVVKYECVRCHDGTGHPAATQSKHCVQCHKDIVEDRFNAPAASLVRWKARVKDLADAPSLEASNQRLSRGWIERYLLQPHDLRPNLVQSMPRLAISPEDARDLAAYFGSDAPRTDLVGDLGKGRAVLDTKGCGSCHAFGGVAALALSPPPAMDGREFERARKLAPDLRFVRDRMSASSILAWLADPKAIKSDAAMPKIALTDEERKDVTAFLLQAPLADPPPKPKLARLPVLTRKVTYKEVDEKVFHRTCWHCHSEPDYAIGDGGPGNSGGFGFAPRGLNLSDYSGIAAGFLDEKRERQSIFAKEADGVPRIVRALVVRHDEESGAATGSVRGMPLGYAPLGAEEIQLVETWVAQGRPR